MTSYWTNSAVAGIALSFRSVIPLIDPATVVRMLPGFDLWDYWPVLERDGRVATIGGGTLLMMLSAPILPDPEARHAVARIRLVHQTSNGVRDLGNLFPDDYSPGSREWSGSAIVSAAHDRLTVFFTAAGHRGEDIPTFDQRLFQAECSISAVDDLPVLGPFSQAEETVAADGVTYTREMAGGGMIGTIKAFRDPAWFQDPVDHQEYIVFTASLAASSSAWNGGVGLAKRNGGGWTLCNPLINADGVNNELERPHILYRRSRYYCFWSTQRKVFATECAAAPTGLYGMVADQMQGPWRPLNDTGLVAANPNCSPLQAYSWLVLDDLSVLSFVDRPGLSRDPDNSTIARHHFCGTPAPRFHLRLEVSEAVII